MIVPLLLLQTLMEAAGRLVLTWVDWLLWSTHLHRDLGTPVIRVVQSNAGILYLFELRPHSSSF